MPSLSSFLLASSRQRQLRLVNHDGAARRTERVRTGRLPLPERVTQLTTVEEPALDGVNAFVDALAELPRNAWLDIGRAIVNDGSTRGARSAAWDILDATIAECGLGIAAWYVRDAVETSAYLAGSSARHWSRTDRRSFAAAHGAAEEAALALLARRHLSKTDFDALYSPFAGVEDVTTARA